ncbi:MAG: glycosyltransferase family 39 protein [Pseudomonadota bacterium]
MEPKTWSEILWGKHAKLFYLMFAATVMLLTLLGSREIWTQEHRWADIVYGMFYRHDFLHPYLNNVDYYDKPLLSYWLIAGFSFLTGQFSIWAMRLPSALAGLLAVWSIYKLGTKLQDQRLGLLSGWILITTFYFIFWAKTSSADMLNLGGTVFAVYWYYETKDRPSFFNYAVFFMVLALTSLCKGLVGAIVPLIVIFPDLLQRQQWKNHLRWSFLFAMLPALIVYVLPFWASSHVASDGYGESGLMLVYRENVLRYFQPFDHKGPIYTYFIYLPIYLLPWAFFLVPTLWSLKSRWKNMSPGNRAMSWAVLLLFIFFTLSGSRRNYYVLPMVPFAILMIAEWFLTGLTQRSVWAGRLAVSFFLLLFLSFDVVQPLYYSQGGLTHFANTLESQASKIKPWSTWHFVMLDPESKIRFYLHLPPTVKDYPMSLDSHTLPRTVDLSAAMTVLTGKEPGVIFITRKSYEAALKNILPEYRVVEAHQNFGERLLKRQNENAAVAFIPPA